MISMISMIAVIPKPTIERCYLDQIEKDLPRHEG